MEKPTWKLQAEAERTSLPDYWTIAETSRLCGYGGSSYLARQAQAGKFLSYKVGKTTVVPNAVAEMLYLKSMAKG